MIVALSVSIDPDEQQAQLELPFQNLKENNSHPTHFSRLRPTSEKL